MFTSLSQVPDCLLADTCVGSCDNHGFPLYGLLPSVHGRHVWSALFGGSFVLPDKKKKKYKLYFVCLFSWFFNVLVNYLVISRTGPKTERLTILRAATHETELGDHDFCLSRSHYTDTDPTSRERAATAGFEPGISSTGVARSTD